jgi:hypothetical protein
MNSIQEAKFRVALHEQILGRDDTLRRELNEEITARATYRLKAGANSRARQVRRMKVQLNSMQRSGVSEKDREYRTLLRNYNRLKSEYDLQELNRKKEQEWARNRAEQREKKKFLAAERRLRGERDRRLKAQAAAQRIKETQNRRKRDEKLKEWASGIQMQNVARYMEQGANALRSVEDQMEAMYDAQALDIQPYVLDEMAARKEKAARNAAAREMVGFANEHMNSAEFEDRVGEQGNPGFARRFQANAHLFPEIGKAQLKCGPRDGTIRMYPFQAVAQSLVSPRTGIDRFLCVWRTGAGKTIAMVKILENFYYDERPKIVIFPTDSVAANFYGTIRDVPSLYKDFICRCLKRPRNSNLSDVSMETVKNILELKRAAIKNNQSENVFQDLRSPMVSFSFTRAGGSSAAKMKKPFNKRKLPANLYRSNPYNGTIVIMDEFHNIVGALQKTKAKQKEYMHADMVQYAPKIKQLADWLKGAKKSVVVGMTATPIVNDPEDGNVLMDVLKGDKYKGASNDGFISYFNTLTPLLYPIPQTEGNGLTFTGSQVYPVEMGAAAAIKYLIEKMKGDATPKKLLAYNNFGVYKNQVRDHRFSGKIDFAFSHAHMYATKLWQIAEDLHRQRGKGMILIHREAGSHGMDKFYKQFCTRFSRDCGKIEYLIRDKEHSMTHNKRIVDEFNSSGNKNGERIKMVIADAKDFSEGVSFINVKNFALANPPSNWAAYLQQMGRVIRSCKIDQGKGVRVRMYVSVIPRKITFKTSDLEDGKNALFKDFKQEYKEFLSKGKLKNLFEKVTTDGKIVDDAFLNNIETNKSRKKVPENCDDHRDKCEKKTRELRDKQLKAYAKDMAEKKPYNDKRPQYNQVKRGKDKACDKYEECKELVSGKRSSFGESHTIVFRDHDDVRKTLDVENYEKLYKDKRILDGALKQQFKEYSVDKGMSYQRESVSLTDTDPSMVLSGQEGLRQHKRDYAVNQLQQWASQRMPKEPEQDDRSPSPSSTVSRGPTPSPVSFPETPSVSRTPSPRRARFHECDIDSDCPEQSVCDTNNKVCKEVREGETEYALKPDAEERKKWRKYKQYLRRKRKGFSTKQLEQELSGK